MIARLLHSGDQIIAPTKEYHGIFQDAEQNWNGFTENTTLCLWFRLTMNADKSSTFKVSWKIHFLDLGFTVEGDSSNVNLSVISWNDDWAGEKWKAGTVSTAREQQYHQVHKSQQNKIFLDNSIMPSADGSDIGLCRIAVVLYSSLDRYSDLPIWVNDTLSICQWSLQTQERLISLNGSPLRKSVFVPFLSTRFIKNKPKFGHFSNPPSLPACLDRLPFQPALTPSPPSLH